MAIIKCPECGHQVSDKAATCPSCGVNIAGKVMRCPECGEVIFKDQTMCPNCHCPLGVELDAGRAQAVASSIQPRMEGIHENDNAKTATEQAVAETAVPDSPQSGKPKKTNKVTVIVAVAFVVALLAVLLGFYAYNHTQQMNENDAYENAMMSSEPAVLQNYLDLYGDAPQEHRDSILAHLEILKQVDADWTNAVVSNSKTALQRYIEMHPNSMHVTEAKVKIDSLDWEDASRINTPDAYQKYITEHQDGLHIDEANDKFEKMNAQKVNSDDKAMVSQLFTSFFSSLSNRDESGLTAVVDNIMTSFLHKSDASKSDVISYMHKLYSEADVTGMNFRVNNDWKIDKKDMGDGQYQYSVSFSVDKKTNFSDPGKDTFDSYRVVAKVSPEGKITELNMQKLKQVEE